MIVKPYWYFVAGLILLYVFTMIARRSPSRPLKPIIPGESRHLLFASPIEGFSSDATFYMFGVDWCPHCKSAKPEFLKLGSTMTIGDRTVAMKYVNPEKEKEAAAGFQVDGYPTFYLQTGAGQQVKYSGPRSAAGFQDFLRQQLAA